MLTAAREAGMVSRTIAALTPEDHDDNQAQGEKRDDGVEIPSPSPSNSSHPSITNTTKPEKKEPNHSTSTKDRKKLSVEECLYLATRGGAACLNLSHKIGAFEVGMEFDAQLIRLSAVPEPTQTPSDDREGDEDDGIVELWGPETWPEKVAKWLFCGDDRNTKRVFVRGRLVWER